MKKLLFLLLIVTSLLSTSCMKRVEGILREEPTEITKKEAVKLMNYYDEQFRQAQTLLKEGDKTQLAAFFKTPEWQLAEQCHSKLLQLPPELATELQIAQFESAFIDFVNETIRFGVPLRELPED